MAAARNQTSNDGFNPNGQEGPSPSRNPYNCSHRTIPTCTCTLVIRHTCTSACFNFVAFPSATSSNILNQLPNTLRSTETTTSMCPYCDLHTAHHIGHIHRPGKKVVRRHNGRLVLERLRRPLLHLNDGSEFVSYFDGPRPGYARRERSNHVRLPMRASGGPHGWGDEYFARGVGGGNGPMPFLEERLHPGRGFGHGGGFHGNHPPRGMGYGYGFVPGYHDGFQDCGRYTTNDGVNGVVEERMPGFGFDHQH